MEDEVLFKNTSKMDDEEIALFQNFALKKSTMISSLIFTLCFVGVGIGLCFIDLTMGITLIVCGAVGGVVLLPYLTKESIKKQNKITLGDKKYLNTFEFMDDCVNVESQATTTKETNDYQPVATQKIFYRDIFKLVLYKEHLFLYINARQSFILNFKGMTKGTVGELVQLLKEKGIKVIDKSYVQTPSIGEGKKKKAS